MRKWQKRGIEGVVFCVKQAEREQTILTTRIYHSMQVRPKCQEMKIELRLRYIAKNLQYLYLGDRCPSMIFRIVGRYIALYRSRLIRSIYLFLKVSLPSISYLHVCTM